MASGSLMLTHLLEQKWQCVPRLFVKYSYLNLPVAVATPSSVHPVYYNFILQMCFDLSPPGINPFRKFHNWHCMSGQKPSHEVQGTLCGPLWLILWWGKDKGEGVSPRNTVTSNAVKWNSFETNLVFIVWPNWEREQEGSCLDYQDPKGDLKALEVLCWNGRSWQKISAVGTVPHFSPKTRAPGSMSEHQSLLIPTVKQGGDIIDLQCWMVGATFT